MTSDGMTGGDQLDGAEQVDPGAIPPAAVAAVPTTHGRAHWALFFGIAATVIVLDQLSKAWLLANVSVGEVVQVVGDLVRLVQSQNSGALFGLFRDQAILFALISIGVMGLIVLYHGAGGSERLPLDRPRAAARRRDRQHGRPVPHGYVVDWVDIGSATCGSGRSTSPTRRSPWPSSCSWRWRCSRRWSAATAATPMPDGQVAAGIRTIRVPDGGRGRVDRFVADATGLSRSYVQKLISDGRLTSEARRSRPTRSWTAARTCDSTSRRRDARVVAAPEIHVEVVYEDDDLLIVDKPAGLVVHPSPGHSDDTLVNALLGRADGAEYGGIAGVAGRESSIASTATRAGC